MICSLLTVRWGTEYSADTCRGTQVNVIKNCARKIFTISRQQHQLQLQTIFVLYTFMCTWHLSLFQNFWQLPFRPDGDEENSDQEEFGCMKHCHATHCISW